MSIKKILFVDTNIWLDFYRARSEAGLSLLKHVEAIKENVIANYQLESEFKNNRQRAIAEGLRELVELKQIQRPGFLSDAKSAKALHTHLKRARAHVKKLQLKIGKALADPGRHDPVYQVCRRIFQRDSPLVLTRENNLRKVIRHKAFRRFLHGCPPRKQTDLSIGDAFNWEWMIHCAIENKAELVIVSRDSDYGIPYSDSVYINDHLRQEFSERVSKKRKILLYGKLSEALKKHFLIPVTDAEKKEEEQLVDIRKTFSGNVKSSNANKLIEELQKLIFNNSDASKRHAFEELMEAGPDVNESTERISPK